MGIAAALGVASLAMGVAGSASSAAAGKAGAKAQHMQAEINRKWSEFEKETELIRQRGAMGLKEFDRLFTNRQIEKDSLAEMVYGRRAAKLQQDYTYHQVYRQFQTIANKQKSSLASRGMGRGGTADAIARQAEADFNNDMVRMRVNNQQQLDAFKNQRSAKLRQRNMRPSDQPPTYIPSTPIPPPNTAGYNGQILGAVAQGLGGLAGVAAGSGMFNSAPAAPIAAMQASGGATAAATQAFGSGQLALGGTFT